MDINSKELFLEILSSLWPLCHLGERIDPGVKVFKGGCRSASGFSSQQTGVNIPLASRRVVFSAKTAEYRFITSNPNHGICISSPSLILNCIKWTTVRRLSSQKRAESQTLPGRNSCFKLIGTVEFQWLPATPRLNIRCIKDPSKNGYYNVFVMEIRMPEELEHFLSCSVAVIMRPCVTKHACFFPFVEKKLNIWIPNCFNWATNETKFTGIIKLWRLARDVRN